MVPDWPLIGEVAKASVPSMVAIVVAYVAWQQWKTAQNKLAVDLFDKRVAAIDAIDKAFSQANMHTAQHGQDADKYAANVAALVPLAAAIAHATWLFGRDVIEPLTDAMRELSERMKDAQPLSDEAESWEKLEAIFTDVMIVTNHIQRAKAAARRYMMLDTVAVSRPR